LPNKLKVEYISIDDIKTYENNAKLHPAEQIEQIKKSIQEFGFNDPIAIDENNVIIEGHGRYIACNELGIKEVPIIRLEGLDEEHKKAYMLVHNKLTMNSNFDIELLSYELEDISIDMSDYGFDMEIEEPEQEIEEVETPEPPEEPKSKLGDIYQLGNHRLMCGDSTDKDDINKLMNGVNADISFTSPPYNAGSLDIKGNETTQKKYNEYNDNKSEEEYFHFIKTNMELLLNHSNEVFYNIGLVENNKRAIIKLQYEFIDKFKDVIYWEKSSCAPHIQPGIINNLVEFILCFGNGKRKFEEAQFSQGTYWNVIKGNGASQNEYSDIHKATFPMYLPIEIIKNFCNTNGVVIDCFGGTGTTLIACEQLDRKCYMMELDPHYVDVIIERWENYTGKKAVKVC